MKAPYKKAGFTMVEIMFVVAIIGLLASMGVPAILNAYRHAQEQAREANLASIEKAKSMLTLPALVYSHGQSLKKGDAFGEGSYTEENLMACIHGADTLEELAVAGHFIVPGKIGSDAHYIGTRPSFMDD